jgi:hypothetical protein
VRKVGNHISIKISWMGKKSQDGAKKIIKFASHYIQNAAKNAHV